MNPCIVSIISLLEAILQDTHFYKNCIVVDAILYLVPILRAQFVLLTAGQFQEEMYV